MDFPVIELEPYLQFLHAEGRGPRHELQLPSALKDLCDSLARCLRETGALVIRDPRCHAEDNDRFLDMMEHFFEQSDEFKWKFSYPQLHYQVGVTPEGIEVPRSALDKNMQEQTLQLSQDSRPHMPTGPDRKWRYMWRVGPRPPQTRFKELNAEPVVPDGFPDWVDVMNGWGCKMIAAVEVVAEMLAIGVGVPPKSFTSLMYQGPHMLAPTGSDLRKYNEEGVILAGYHYDLNFLTIHGRCRFPGLFIWLKNLQRIEVRIPAGCLLIQAGKQLEWLTGGVFTSGMHEVVVSNRTLAAIDTATKCGHSLWRVSSTVFGHIASDAILQPLGHFATSPEANKYPAIHAGEYVELELAAINLKERESKDSSIANGESLSV
eukprot:c20879_g1_i1 orf=155-1282(+)